MLNSNLTVLGILAVTALLVGVLAIVTGHFEALKGKMLAETKVLHEQANHVFQTARAEALNAESLIRSYEQQGVNKFKTELARLGGAAGTDLRAIEQKIGSKIAGYSLAEHEAQLAIARKRILDLEATVESLTPKVDLSAPVAPAATDTTAAPVFNGQPSPGAGITISV